MITRLIPTCIWLVYGFSLFWGFIALSFPSIKPAEAASGGGCTGYASGALWVQYEACISALAPGVGRPDAYMSFVPPGKVRFFDFAGCKIFIAGVRLSDKRIMSQAVYPCPAKPAYKKRYAAPDFRANNGRYATFVSVRQAVGILFSPPLTLP